MEKKLTIAAMLVSLLPALANAAWFLDTQARSGGGTIASRNMTGQSVTDGSIFRAYTTSADIPVTVTADPGYTIRSVTIGSTTTDAPASPFSTRLTGSYNDKSFTALFVANSLSVTARNPSGTVSPASVGNLTYGYTLTSPLTFYFSPAVGCQITGVSGIPVDSHVSTSGFSLGVNQRVWAKFDTGYRFTTSLTLAASVENKTPAINPVLPRTVVPGTVVNMSVSAINVPGNSTYTWTYVSGPQNQGNFAYDAAGKLTGINHGVILGLDCVTV
jgi:hypothetical protein